MALILTEEQTMLRDRARAFTNSDAFFSRKPVTLICSMRGSIVCRSVRVLCACVRACMRV